MKDEKVIEVNVGELTSVKISVDKDLTQVTKNDAIEVECVVEEEGNPPVEVTLYHEQQGADREELGDGARSQFEPSLEDTGSVFSCIWSQVGPDGFVFYEGKEHSETLDVLMAPQLLEGEESISEFIFEEGLQLKVPFEAKPWPQEGDILWMLLDDDDNSVSIEHYMGQGMKNSRRIFFLKFMSQT